MPATSGALRAAGVTEFAPPTPAMGLAHNRFFSLATESEDEQSARRTTIGEETSDTMSLIGIRNSRRRLRLRWSEHAPSTANVPGNVLAGAPHEPDSHDMRLMRVREAMQRDGQPPRGETGSRGGQVSGSAQWASRSRGWCAESDARVVCFQCSSHVGSCSRDRSCAVLEWLAQSVRDVSIRVEMPGHEAVMAGWETLHLAVDTMGIQSVEGLSEWIHGQGFPQPRWGAHFSGASTRTALEQSTPG